MNVYLCELIFKTQSRSEYWFPFFVECINNDEAKKQMRSVIKGLEEQGYELIYKGTPQISNANTELLDEYIKKQMRGNLYSLRADMWSLKNLNIQLDLGFNEHLELLRHEGNEGKGLKALSRKRYPVGMYKKGEYFDEEFGDFLTVEIIETRKTAGGVVIAIDGVYPVHQWAQIPNESGIAYVFKECDISLERGSIELGILCEISEQTNLSEFAHRIFQGSEKFVICYSLTSSIKKEEDKELISQVVHALNLKFRPENSLPDKLLYINKYEGNSVSIKFNYKHSSSWYLEGSGKIGVLEELVGTFAWIPQKVHL